MANEIQVGLGGAVGGGKYELLFLFDIPAGIRIKARDETGAVTAANVAPTPASEAPAWAKLTDAEVTALDAGEKIFRTARVRENEGATAAQLLAKIQGMYSTMQSELQAKYEARYKHLNKRLDA